MGHIEGYEIPIHRSLTEKMMIAGVPRALAIINGTMATGFGLSFHSWWVLPIFFIIHIAAVLAHKKDPQAFEVFQRHVRHKTYYDT